MKSHHHACMHSHVVATNHIEWSVWTKEDEWQGCCAFTSSSCLLAIEHIIAQWGHSPIIWVAGPCGHCTQCDFHLEQKPEAALLVICLKANLSKFFSVLVHNFSVLEHPFLLCPVLSRVPSRFLAVPARPVPDFDRLSRHVLSHGKILSLSHCPFVPGQWRNFCPSVLKSCTVLSHWKPYIRPYSESILTRPNINWLIST